MLSCSVFAAILIFVGAGFGWSDSQTTYIMGVAIAFLLLIFNIIFYLLNIRDTGATNIFRVALYTFYLFFMLSRINFGEIATMSIDEATFNQYLYLYVAIESVLISNL